MWCVGFRTKQHCVILVYICASISQCVPLSIRKNEAYESTTLIANPLATANINDKRANGLIITANMQTRVNIFTAFSMRVSFVLIFNIHFFSARKR